MSASRRRTRVFLVQVLYSDAFFADIILPIFTQSYADELSFSNIDNEYFHALRKLIHENASHLLGIISTLSPKFDLETLPKIHLVILLVALSELIYFSESIPEKVAVNEAIELTKIFSDESGAKFINGTLGNFVRDREKYLNSSISSFQFFQ